MKFHVSSFMLGCVVGAGSATLAPRLRPLALELATAAYQVADASVLAVVRGREAVEDLLAEAKARARGYGRDAGRGLKRRLARGFGGGGRNGGARVTTPVTGTPMPDAPRHAPQT